MTKEREALLLVGRWMRRHGLGGTIIRKVVADSLGVGDVNDLAPDKDDK